MFEIDATGGRLFLVSSGANADVLRKPTIYVVIDRWSRYVVSIYISVNPPSYEEVRQALLIAFTSRSARFVNLGINIDDQRWPIGQMPFAIVADRGSEFMSESFEKAVVDELKIELIHMPPYCPDGKAIVERFIGTLKQRMANSKLKGVFADRPMDPATKRVAKKAKAAAVHTLAEAYRELIDIVTDYNGRPHSTLRRNRELAHAGVEPTPIAAYAWGLENITGRRVPPHTDEHYRSLLLSFDKANISNGVLRYKGRAYTAKNEHAVRLLLNAPKRAKAVDIRLDMHAPYELAISTSGGNRAIFQITPGGLREISGTTLDEIEVFSKQTAVLNAEAESKSRIERLSKIAAPARRAAQAGKASSGEDLDKLQVNALSDHESTKIKNKLWPNERSSVEKKSEPGLTTLTVDWQAIEDEENRRNAEIIREQWNKK
jgi:transposase InsO family protein